MQTNPSAVQTLSSSFDFIATKSYNNKNSRASFHCIFCPCYSKNETPSLIRPVNYKISFPADYKNIPPIRDLSYHVAKMLGFSEKNAEHIRSVIDELGNNAIEYGSQPTSEVILEIFADENAMRIACHDQGLGNKLKAEDIKKTLQEELPQNATRGRGLRMIVKAFTDTFDITDRLEGGITVTATIKNSN
jgi:anti-sigma regulatory factor (Ser/Thr protein kinase)